MKVVLNSGVVVWVEGANNVTSNKTFLEPTRRGRVLATFRWSEVAGWWWENDRVHVEAQP